MDNIERLNYVDAAKTIAILFVCVYHSGFPTNLNFPVYFLCGLLSICVPMFFLVNGFLLLNNSFDFKVHIFRIAKIYALFLLWSSLTMANEVFLGHLDVNADLIRAVMYLRQGDNNHLWYLLTIVSVYILLPLTKLAYDANDARYILWTVSVLGFFGFFMPFYSRLAGIFSWAAGARIPTGYPFSTDIIPFSGYYYANVYFIVGGLLARAAKSRMMLAKRYLVIISIASLLSLFSYGVLVSKASGEVLDTVWHGYNTFPTFTLTCSIFMIIMRTGVSEKFRPLVASIGANTFGIYVLHMLFLKWFKPFIIGNGDTRTVANSLGLASAIFLVSWGMTLLLRRVPGVRHVISL